MRTAAQVLIVLLVAGCPLLQAAAPVTAPKAGQAVTAIAPTPTTLTRRLLATGSIHAWQEVIIAPEVGGYQVASVDVEIGDRVKRGQQLARLSSELLESQVAIARASVMQAEASLANVRASLSRGESMAEKGALSRADLDTLRSNAIAAEAGVATAQANLDSAELRLRFTRVRAPDDGTITARSVNVGQVVQAGTEMMRLLRRDRIEWRAEVPEADLRSVRAGQKVQVTLVEGGTLAGKVRTVAPTVQSSNRTGIIYVDIASDGGARPGMFARGTIEVSSASALMVPTASILVQDGYSYAFVLRADNTVQRRRVQTGAVQAGLIEVTQGLAATDRVVASGVAFLADGQHVNPRPAA
jgi:RND family efflux transporter MFP subunit